MPLFHWVQVVLLCAVTFVLGYFAARELSKRRRPMPPRPVTEQTPERSHETPALRVIEDQFRAGRLGFDECLELAATYRRQGDIQAAIEIHQSLYGRPGLKWEDLQSAQFELATDFYHAGIFGRSEDLLRSLVNHPGGRQFDGLRLLLRIYQQEQEWDKAVALFDRHAALSQGDLAWTYVHVLCEKAELCSRRDAEEALELAQKAGQSAPRSLRPLLIRLRLAFDTRHWRSFQRELSDWIRLAPERTDLLLPVLVQVVERWPSRRSALFRVLQQAHDNAEVRLLMGQLHWETGSFDKALTQIKTVPLTGETLRWRLEYLAHREDVPDLQDLVSLLRSHIGQMPGYRCRNCGFEAKVHVWRCPQCEHWETLAPGTGSLKKLFL